ncbi:MAG: DUF5817 domain-containing protein [Thermoplasmatota archaeon]
MTWGKFGIVVCPNCQYAKAVDLSNNKTKCSHCGKNLKISKLKVYYESKSQKETSWAVGRLNAKIRGGELPEGEKEREKSPHKKAKEEASVGDNKKEKIVIIIKTLTRELGQVERHDIEKMCDLMGWSDVDSIIEKIRKLEDEIYEPKTGVFKAIEV